MLQYEARSRDILIIFKASAGTPIPSCARNTESKKKKRGFHVRFPYVVNFCTLDQADVYGVVGDCTSVVLGK